jgi:hypothetical protein
VLGLNAMTTFTVLLVLWCAFAALARAFLRRQGPDSQPDSDDWGGGNKRREPRGPQDGGGGEPPWWPEFERHFAEYVRGRELVPARGR